jgi:hypothetical protein
MKLTPSAPAKAEAVRMVRTIADYLNSATPARSEEEIDTFIRSLGGRPTTPEESRMFWKAIKESYR